MKLIKTIFSRKWIGATILVIVGMGVMIRLGIWQLDRLEQRRAANAVLLAVLESEPLTLNEARLPDDLESLKDRQVIASGSFDFDQQVVLLLQNWSGQTGVHLLTPFVLDGLKTAVLVDRGWVPQREVETDNLTRYETADHHLEGFVALSQPPPRYGNPEAQPDGPQTEVYRVDVEMLRAQMPYELLPFYVLQAPEGNEAPPFRAEPEVDLSEGPHLSYAIQWFLFTMILGGGYLIYVNKKISSVAKSAPETAAEGSGTTPSEHSR